MARPGAAAAAAITDLLRDEYGISGEVVRLAGTGETYRVTATDGRRFILKLADAQMPAAAFDLERALVERAAAGGIGLAFPRYVAPRSSAVEPAGPSPSGPPGARLLEYVPGTPWGEAAPPTPARRRDAGRALGALARALDGFDHAAARRSHPWDLARAAAHRDKIGFVEDDRRRRLLEQAFHLYAAAAAPVLSGLPHAVIHGDANDENVLVEADRVTGLIDFGDCLWNPVVCELAIALAYLALDEPHPLAAAAEIVAAYHTERPLSADELAVLFPLMVGRLASSVAQAAANRRIDPHHPTWFVTEDRAWRLLETLMRMEPADAAGRLAPAGVTVDVDEDAPVPALLDRRRRHVSAALSIAYDEPLKIVRGRGQCLFDRRGRPFLDLVNNVCHVGHCHPRVVEAGARAMARLNTNTRYLHDGLVEYAERLTATLPAPLEVCFFVNSGSEANELALRLARARTKRRDVVVLDQGYHGHTSTLVAMSPYKFMGPGGAGRAEPWVHVAPLPDGYRGRHRGHTEAAGIAYGDEVARAIAEAGAPVAAFLAEPLPSCGGQIVPPPGWLATAARHVREAGGVVILDEVQTGFGRVGRRFWAFELHDVVPDIVVMGKPMGNGHPIGAVVTTREIASAFENGMEFFSTFGGNPVSMAVGLAVLDVIRDERLQAHALEVGTRLREGLRSLMDRHPMIGDVRGEGLFIGVELVRSRETLEPADTEAAALVNRLKDRGLLLSTDGPFHNVIKIKPPMVLTADDADMVVRVMNDELRET